MTLKLILSRREFIKAASAAGCLLPMSGVSNLVWGQSIAANPTAIGSPAVSDKPPLLVSVFLRGGADGLLLVSPTNDLDFIDARPSDLRVLDSGSRAGFLLAQSNTPNTSFYLHPDAPGLAELYQAKHLAVMHAVGITDATRSHEEAQAIIERGALSVKHDRGMLKVPGWMSRSIMTSSAAGHLHNSIPAYSASTIAPLSLEGINNALVTPDLNAGLGVPWGKPTAEFLAAMSTQQTGLDQGSSSSANAQSVHSAMRDALQMQDNINLAIARDATGKVLPYLPSGTANYDGAGELARSFSSIARLAKMQVGLQVANINFGGWDTHEGQSGHFANMMRQLSKGLTAFYEDMAASNQSVTVIVMTEFGRRVRSNKSNGTDHGHGACWFALGDHVKGGNLYGQWPGLSSLQMDQGLDLAVTNDYRQVLSEAMQASHLNVTQALLNYPSSVASKPLGLFG